VNPLRALPARRLGSSTWLLGVALTFTAVTLVLVQARSRTSSGIAPISFARLRLSRASDGLGNSDPRAGRSRCWRWSSSSWSASANGHGSGAERLLVVRPHTSVGATPRRVRPRLRAVALVVVGESWDALRATSGAIPRTVLISRSVLLGVLAGLHTPPARTSRARVFRPASRSTHESKRLRRETGDLPPTLESQAGSGHRGAGSSCSSPSGTRPAPTGGRATSSSCLRSVNSRSRRRAAFTVRDRRRRTDCGRRSAPPSSGASPRHVAPEDSSHERSTRSSQEREPSAGSLPVVFVVASRSCRVPHTRDYSRASWAPWSRSSSAATPPRRRGRHGELRRRASSRRRLWNEMETGGALEWCLWPQRRVAFDGRSAELHALAGTWPLQSTVVHARDGWEKVLTDGQCELALARRGFPVEETFRTSPLADRP